LAKGWCTKGREFCKERSRGGAQDTTTRKERSCVNTKNWGERQNHLTLKREKQFRERNPETKNWVAPTNSGTEGT